MNVAAGQGATSSDSSQPDPDIQIAEQHGVGEAVFQEKPRYLDAASYRSEGAEGPVR